jgi:hypothetical protein
LQTILFASFSRVFLIFLNPSKKYMFSELIFLVFE